MLFPFLQSADFLPGVRYQFSLYSCSAEPSQLLQRWQGYMQELGKSRTEGKKIIICWKDIEKSHGDFLFSFPPSWLLHFLPSPVPSSPVILSAHQEDSDVVLTWGKIPLVSGRGYILGYNIYISRGPQLTLIGRCHVIFETATVFQSNRSHLLPSPCLFHPVLLTANLTDSEATTYRVKGYTEGTFKFVVKTYTAAGEETGATASITMEQYGMWLYCLLSWETKKKSPIRKQKCNTAICVKISGGKSTLLKVWHNIFFPLMSWQLIGWSWKSCLLWESQLCFWLSSHSFVTRNGNGKTTITPTVLPVCLFFIIFILIF